MKKTFAKVAAVAATLVLGAALIAGCSSSSSSSSASSSAATADTSADIDTLTVGFDNSYPPYGYIGTDGEYTGFDIDLATEVAERNGWDLQLEAIDWDAKDALLDQGSVNCIWNGFTMEGREGKYTFSEPYMLNGQVVVVKADSGITTTEDLAGKVVTTQIGSAAEELLLDDFADLADTFAALDPVADYNNAFMQLEAGNVNAVICDLSIANYQMAANPGVYAMIDELSTEHYVVAFKLGDEALAKQVSETLADMYADGTIQNICEKYEADGISYENWLLK